MNIRRLMGSLIVVSVSFASSAVAQAPSSAAVPTARNSSPDSEMDTYLENARRQWNLPGLAVAVVHADKVVLAKGYGVRTLGRPGRVNADTVFNIASLTKTFTSAAAGVLVDEGTPAEFIAPDRRA